MEQDVFKAGLRPGSPNTLTEIKMLICYILPKAGEAMSFMQLYEALDEDHLVNYFDLTAVIDALLQSGHLSEKGEPGRERTYFCSEVGAQAGEEFKSALPLSVKERALRAAKAILARRHRLAELECTETPVEGGGFRLRLAIPQEEGALAAFELFVPTKEECELVKKRFLNAPSFIYKGVLALLTGEQAVLDEIFPPEEEQIF